MTQGEPPQPPAQTPTVKPSWRRTRALYLRFLGLTLLCAVGSYWSQIIALNGEAGLAPAAEYAEAVAQVAESKGWSSWERFLNAPSLYVLAPSDGALHGLAALASLGCLLLIAGWFAGPGLLMILLGWGSIVAVGGVFTGYQWDIFNLEVCFASLFIAPWLGRSDAPPLARTQHDAGRWLLRIVLFKFMLLQGLVKWRSGDASWEQWTALDYHFWTQPIPHALSWWAHQLPETVDKALVGGMYLVELVLPFAMLGPRRARLIAAVGTVALMLGIMATGNYGTFNLLTLALCVTLLDDGHLAALKLAPRAPTPATPAADGPPSRIGWTIARWALVAPLMLCNLQAINSRAHLELPAPELLTDTAQLARRLYLCAPYGAFSHMTKDRPEIAIEASMDGQTWRPYVFRYKTLALDQSHGFAAGHMPRLDWQLWFASLRRSCRAVRWYPALLRRLLQAEPNVLALFAEVPFNGERPRLIRSTLWDYSFTTYDERRERGHVWSRSRVDSYCPTVKLVGDRVRLADEGGGRR